MTTENDTIDVESYRLGAMPYEPPLTKTKKVRCYEPGTWYIASIPGDWIAEAAKLPGHALHVALAIMYAHGMGRKETVVLSRFHFDRFSTSRGSARRGLDALQQAGLIEYTKAGQKYKVTVIAIES